MMNYQKVDILHVNNKIVLSHVYLERYDQYIPHFSYFALKLPNMSMSETLVILHPELCDNKCLVYICVDCHSHN